MAVLKTPSVLKEKGICHMKTPSISTLPDPSGFSVDLLTDILRAGARDLIQQAVEAELSALLATQAQDLTADGRARLVRHGHLPERDVVTGIGRCRSKCPASEIAETVLRRSASHRRFCPRICARPNPSKSFCPGCI